MLKNLEIFVKTVHPNVKFHFVMFYGIFTWRKEEKKYLINNDECRNGNKYKSGGAKIGQIYLNWFHRHVHCFNNKKLDAS